MRATAEADLIARAQSGDRDAFAALYAPLERPLAAFLYRMTAARQDAEDLAQETALRAIEAIGEIDLETAASFRVWIFRLAVDAAIGYLRGRAPWDPDAQIRAGYKAADNAALRKRMKKLHQSGLHTTYDLREHVDFCLTVMGRTLPPQEAAALLVADAHGFTTEEAAQTMSVSPQVFEFRLQQARQTLVEHFDSRCGLINKDGSCNQCAALDALFYGDQRHTQEALFALDLEPQTTAAARAATLVRRLALARSIDPLRAAGARLHDALMTFTREVNGYR